jgi:hypothetical protein
MTRYQNNEQRGDQHIDRHLEAPELVPGWYAIGFEHDDGAVRFDVLAQYHGDGYWTDDDGEEKDRLWDPIIQNWVAMDAADRYVKQGG